MNEKLNICLMNDSFPPTIDGVANVVVNYAKHITASHGICAVATPEYPDVVDDYPFPVVRYPSIDTTQLVGYRAGNPLAPETIETLRRMRFNLIHSHCPVASTVLARELRNATGAPLIFTYHTKFDIDIAKAVRSHLLQQAAIDVLVRNISACDEVWVVSEGAGENLRSLGYEGEYLVMPNGVDLEKGQASAAALEALNQEWRLPADAPVFLFLGRMMWYKGQKLILNGLKRLAEAGRDFCMVFVGDGQDRAEIEAYADELGLSDRCRFVGAVHNREQVRAWYCRADLLLFPSTFDTNGLVVREAAACGLGSLLVRGSCAAEGVTDGQNGILIEENGESLGAALMDLDVQKMRDVGQHAMDELYLSWQDSVAMAAERYHIVLERQASGELQPKTGRMRGLYTLEDEVRGEIAAALDTADAMRDTAKNAADYMRDTARSTAGDLRDTAKTTANAMRSAVRDSFREAAEELQRELNRAQNYIGRYL